MNLGNLYLVKEWFWLLFPTKETTAAADVSYVGNGMPMPMRRLVSSAVAATAYWSKYFNCEVTYFSPDSYIVFLEEDGIYKRVLTADGKVGWTWFNESYNDCFEEVKQ